MKFSNGRICSLRLVLALPSLAVSAAAQEIQFQDIAENGGAGLNFVHGISPRNAAHQALLDQSLVQPLTFEDVTSMPSWPNGVASVAILDYDNDGDDDIYLGNSKESPNALFSNRLIETGELSFIDVSIAAGVDATNHDSAGVCCGDIDNDGDQDLFVVGINEPYLLFQNNGDGTFVDIAIQSGDAFAGAPGAEGCVMGDVDNDGWLDIHVGHAWDFESTEPCQLEPFIYSLPNELFRNLGDGRFEEVSADSGIHNLVGGDIEPGIQGNTHAVAMYDYDLDGDLDIFNFDDNCAFPFKEFGGIDHGHVQLFQNDGTGNFVNRSIEAGTDIVGTWMGVAIADFNHDGELDFFGTQTGDYMGSVFNLPGDLGSSSSRWILGQPGGTFTDPGLGDLLATTFGWGTVARDFDNDGDTDVAYVGGLNLSPIWISDTPGNILLNDGDANFHYVRDALSTDYIQRNPQGLATGDFNNDGFPDLVVASNATFPEDGLLLPVPVQFGAEMDDTAFFYPILDFQPDGTSIWTGQIVNDGQVAVEINQADSGLHSTLR